MKTINVLSCKNSMYSFFGKGGKEFARNVGIVGVGVIVSSLLTVGFTVAAGRVMGPEAYGIANIMLYTGQVMAILMGAWVSTGATRYIASEKNKDEFLSSFFILALGSSVVFGAVFFFSRPFMTRLLEISDYLFLLTLVYAATLVLHEFSQAVFRGFRWFRLFAFSYIGTAFVFAGVMATFLFKTNVQSEEILVIPSIVRWALLGAIVLFAIRKRLRAPTFQATRRLVHYGLNRAPGMVPVFFVGVIDRLVILHVLGAASVGVYSAYFLAFHMIGHRGLDIILPVFFPTVSASQDKRSIFLKINMVWRYVGVPLGALLFAAIWLLLLLFGEEYTPDFLLIFLFVLATFSFLVANIYSWLIASLGPREVRFTSIQLWVSLSIHFLGSIIFIQTLGLYGVVLSLLIALGYQIIMFYRYLYNYFQDA